MNHWKTTTPTKRKRTCYDKLRAQMIAARRNRKGSPAATISTQLTTLLATVFGRMPIPAPVFSPYVAPPMSPGHARRRDIAKRLGVPTRYADIALSRGSVPYSVLFEHIRRGGRSRQDAMSVLHQQAPDSCRDWLDHIEEWGMWSALLLCHVRDGDDEDTDVKLLKSTLAWLEVRKPDPVVPDPADAGTASTSGPGGDNPNSDDDPNKPKP